MKRKIISMSPAHPELDHTSTLLEVIILGFSSSKYDTCILFHVNNNTNYLSMKYKGFQYSPLIFK